MIIRLGELERLIQAMKKLEADEVNLMADSETWIYEVLVSRTHKPESLPGDLHPRISPELGKPRRHHHDS